MPPPLHRLSRTREGAMPGVILPNTFVRLLAAFEPCFRAPSYRNFGLLVAGWIHCLGRRTITAVALAAGAVGERHVSVFHRFFARAEWVLDDLGRVLFGLALAWIPADQPLYVVIDDTLAQGRQGDRARRDAPRPVAVDGPQAVLQLRPRLGRPSPLGAPADGRLPRVRPADPVPPVRRRQAGRSTRRALAGNHRGAAAGGAGGPSAGAPAADEAGTGPRDDRARPHLGERAVYAVVDSAYAGQALLERRPPTVHVISRLRMDAALWTRPRRVFALTALWYAALPEHP